MADLSPAAWAALEAGLSHSYARRSIAAALRALAHHQHPAWNGTGPACHWTPTPHTRRELLNIATELDGHD